ncbi:MAG: hypothetical protein Q8L48_42795 [Archangium sp.]|nr:hypothetical protein [Archangium sp.]
MVSRIGPPPQLQPSVPRVETPRRPPPPPVGKAFGNEFSSGRGTALRARALTTSGATTLRNEVRGDANANCLERAAALAQPGDSVMLLIDGDGVGHAVVLKPSGQIVDPNFPGQPASSLAAYLAANPRYQPGPAISDRVLEQLLSIPPGPQRDLFIQAAGLSRVASLKVNDDPSPIGPTIGTAAEGALPDPASWPVMTTVFMADPTEAARCRASPSSSGTVCGSFGDAEPLTVLGQEPPAPAAAQWYQVEGTGSDGEPLTGWVGASLVREPALQIDPRLNERMQALGYVEPGGSVDANDLRNFQLMNGLPPSGEPDEATLTLMWSADARLSTFITQFETSTYNAEKDTPGGDNSCGPASVAMNLAALGLITVDNADPQAVIATARTDSGTTAPNTTGTDQLKAAAEAGGATTTDVEDMDGLDAALARGEPVVLYGVPNQAGTWSRASDTYDTGDFGFIHEESAHWISVIGRTPEGDYVIQDPLSREGTITVTREELEVYAVWDAADGTPSSFSMSIAPPVEPTTGPR